MKRILLVLLGAAALFVGVRAIVRALASDETKIRWLVLDMADGFDRTRMDPILAGLARGYVDLTSGVDRDGLRQALAYLFFTAKEETSKKFPYRVEVAIRRIEVRAGEEDRRTAECELDLTFLARHGEIEKTSWAIAVSARLERGDDGWRIVTTTHDTTSGRRIR